MRASYAELEPRTPTEAVQAEAMIFPRSTVVRRGGQGMNMRALFQIAAGHEAVEDAHRDQTAVDAGGLRAGGTLRSDVVEQPAARALYTAEQAQRIAEELRRASTTPRVRQARRSAAGRVARLLDEHARLDLERRITAHLPGGRLALSITDNRHTMISIRRARGPLFRVRLHHMFFDAPPNVARALARYVAVNDPSSSRLLGMYIESCKDWIRHGRRRTLCRRS